MMFKIQVSHPKDGPTAAQAEFVENNGGAVDGTESVIFTTLEDRADALVKELAARGMKARLECLSRHQPRIKLLLAEKAWEERGGQVSP